MRALVFFVQLLLWLLIIRLVVRGLTRIFSGASARRPASPRRGPPSAIEDLVLDRVCHTYVPRSQAVPGRIAGREEQFCSPECRDKALAAVARAS